MCTCMYTCVCACVCSTGMKCVVYRIPYHQDDILKSLVRLVSDCCQEDGALPKPKSAGKPQYVATHHSITLI